MAWTKKRHGEVATIYQENISAGAYGSPISTYGAKCVYITSTKASATARLLKWDATSNAWHSTVNDTNTLELTETAVVDQPTNVNAGFIVGTALPPMVAIKNGNAAAAVIQVIVVFK